MFQLNISGFCAVLLAVGGENRIENFEIRKNLIGRTISTIGLRRLNQGIIIRGRGGLFLKGFHKLYGKQYRDNH